MKATSISRGMASTVETQNRGFVGLIFSSPVMSATASAPDLVGHLVVDLARQEPQRQPDHPRGMREHPLDREMGLAGIGGPSTAVTPAPRARSRAASGEKMDNHYASGTLALARERRAARHASTFLYHNATLSKLSASELSSERVWNESRPNR